MNIVSRHYSFEAAHRLTGVPPGHKCSRLHGHSFKVEVAVEAVGEQKLPSGIVIPVSALDAQGMVVDFDVIDRAWAPTFVVFDHDYLNNHIENPTSENIAKIICENVQSELDRIAERKLEVVYVTVCETERSSATYRPLRTWKQPAPETWEPPLPPKGDT